MSTAMPAMPAMPAMRHVRRGTLRYIGTGSRGKFRPPTGDGDAIIQVVTHVLQHRVCTCGANQTVQLNMRHLRPLRMAGTCDVRMRLSFSPETSSAHCLIEAISCSASAALGLTDDAALTSTERSDADTNELAASVAIPTVPRAPDSSRRWVRLFFPQNTNTKLRHRGQARGSSSGARIGQRVTRTVDCGFESTKRQFRATQQCFPTVFLMM